MRVCSIFSRAGVLGLSNGLSCWGLCVVVMRVKICLCPPLGVDLGRVGKREGREKGGGEGREKREGEAGGRERERKHDCSIMLLSLS